MRLWEAGYSPNVLRILEDLSDYDLIHEHKIEGEEGKLVVMSTDERASGEIERRYAKVLDDFHVRFIPFAKSRAFAEEIEKTAH